jgi:XTP/dITP diphosphohydrolase
VKTLLIATDNTHKVREISAILHELGRKDIKLPDLTAYPDYAAPEESGASFAENARIKALAAAAYTGYPALADDSGLMVAALDGAPGIYSARYAGAGHDDAANNAKLLTELADTPQERRQAAFCCFIALARPDGRFWLAEGRLEGIILKTPRGCGGFGYDPLFYLPPDNRTLAELDPKEKNRWSHRALALENALPLLENLWP